jgi:AraC family transcriptional regulator, chitin signaling transcriptional activator
LCKDFSQRLKGKYPALTDYESQLIQLIRMNLSSKEIAVLLDITPHSVNVSRYRLRKKLNIKKEDSLTDCFAKL